MARVVLMAGQLLKKHKVAGRRAGRGLKGKEIGRRDKGKSSSGLRRRPFSGKSSSSSRRRRRRW
jgi:hypothetical protein